MTQRQFNHACIAITMKKVTSQFPLSLEKLKAKGVLVDLQDPETSIAIRYEVSTKSKSFKSLYAGYDLSKALEAFNTNPKSELTIALYSPDEETPDLGIWWGAYETYSHEKASGLPNNTTPEGKPT